MSAIKVAQRLLAVPLQKARCIIDATAGNGNDTLYLANASSDEARVYAFDIQREALEATRKKTASFVHKIRYVLDSHVHFEKHVEGAIDVAMFNLGYLPGGSHAVTTQAETTLVAVEKMTARLVVNGLLVVAAYPGHAAGEKECHILNAWLAALPSHRFTASCYAMLNHEKKPPILYIVERVRS